jgi:hypothetical protein
MPTSLTRLPQPLQQLKDWDERRPSFPGEHWLCWPPASPCCWPRAAARPPSCAPSAPWLAAHCWHARPADGTVWQKS